jgi:D-alanine-D-alanine ligase
MINVAILTGGPSAERGIALKSAVLVQKYLDTSRYRHWTILVEEDGWFEEKTGQRIDLNDFSLNTPGGRITFDFAFLIIHGTPVEDGKLQGYFEVLGIPHSTCDTLTSALTFNKQWCKDFLSVHKVPMARSWTVNSGKIDDVDPAEYDYPVFVKPNNNGSSYGVSKVDHMNDLAKALVLAAKYDTEVMIEEFLAGREFSSGAMRKDGEIHVFPATEIIPDGVFFDYAAKYQGAGQEITPADLTEDEAARCAALSRRLYDLLHCRGMVRFDYILAGSTFNLLEVNTVPGLSETSIIPQQVRAYGWDIADFLHAIVQEALTPTSHY